MGQDVKVSVVVSTSLHACHAECESRVLITHFFLVCKRLYFFKITNTFYYTLYIPYLGIEIVKRIIKLYYISRMM